MCTPRLRPPSSCVGPRLAFFRRTVENLNTLTLSHPTDSVWRMTPPSRRWAPALSCPRHPRCLHPIFPWLPVLPSSLIRGLLLGRIDQPTHHLPATPPRPHHHHHHRGGGRPIAFLIHSCTHPLQLLTHHRPTPDPPHDTPQEGVSERRCSLRCAARPGGWRWPGRSSCRSGNRRGPGG